MKRHTAALAITLLALFTLIPAISQAHERPDDAGLYLGIQLVGANMHFEKNNDLFIEREGGGLAMMLGYHLNDVFALELGINAYVFETGNPDVDIVLGGSQLFAVYRFRPGRSFRPHVKGGLGGNALVIDDVALDPRIEGSSASFGSGFSYFLNSHLTVGLDYTMHIIEYDTLVIPVNSGAISLNIDEQSTTGALGIAFMFHF